MKHPSVFNLAIITFTLFTIFATASLAKDRLPVTGEDFPFLKEGITPEQFGKTGRLQMIDAPTVKVWLTTIRPNVPLKYHRHLTGRLIIPMQDMELVKNYDKKSGKKAETMVWKKGKAYFYDADEVGVYHNEQNTSSKPLQVMVVAFRTKKSEPVIEIMPSQ